MRVYASLLCLTLFTGCFGYRDALTEADYSYFGDFRKYRTFGFMDADTANGTFDGVLRDLVAKRLDLQGYRLVDQNPDLLITYRLYTNDLRFQGYNQPTLESWVRYGESEEEYYDPVRYRLNKGTLLVVFYDQKSQQTIWQGYTSGVFGNLFLSNERNLSRAVRSILDRYRLFARDYAKQQRRRRAAGT